MRTSPPVASVIKALKKLEDSKQGPLLIVEVGAIADSSVPAIIHDGYSTVYIARYIETAKFNHAFYSVDLNITVAAQILAEKGIRHLVSLMEGRALDVFRDFFQGVKIDLLYFDGSMDPAEVLAEYKAIEDRIADNAIVIIDDIETEKPEDTKGKEIVPYIRSLKKRHVNENDQLVIYYEKQDGNRSEDSSLETGIREDQDFA